MSTTQQKPEKNNIRTVIIFASVLLVLGFLAWGVTNSQSEGPVMGEPAPDFTATFFEGYEWDGRQEAKLSDMKGNVVVINFWASWCLPCRKEAPLLEAMWREYEDDGVIFLGMAYTDIDSKAVAYLQEYDSSFPNAPDLKLRASSIYKTTGVPETFIVDQNGMIVFTFDGELTESMLRTQLNQLLAGN